VLIDKLPRAQLVGCHDVLGDISFVALLLVRLFAVAEQGRSQS
jgi:hypothetical protein